MTQNTNAAGKRRVIYMKTEGFGDDASGKIQRHNGRKYTLHLKAAGAETLDRSGCLTVLKLNGQKFALDGYAERNAANKARSVMGASFIFLS